MYGSIMRARIKDGGRDEYTRFLHEIVPTADDYVEYVGRPVTENG